MLILLVPVINMSNSDSMIQQQTDGVDFIHEDDAGLMVACVAEHLANESSTFTNVLVNNGT